MHYSKKSLAPIGVVAKQDREAGRSGSVATESGEKVQFFRTRSAGNSKNKKYAPKEYKALLVNANFVELYVVVLEVGEAEHGSVGA